MEPRRGCCAAGLPFSVSLESIIILKARPALVSLVFRQVDSELAGASCTIHLSYVPVLYHQLGLDAAAKGGLTKRRTGRGEEGA